MMMMMMMMIIIIIMGYRLLTSTMNKYLKGS